MTDVKVPKSEEEKNRYVQLGDKVFCISFDYSEGVGFREISEMDKLQIAEDAILKGDDSFASSLADTIEDARDNLLNGLRKGINNTVLKSLGFEKSNWNSDNGWSVDHCNGRMSAITEHIKVEVKDLLSAFSKEDLNLISKTEQTKILNSLKKDAREQYKWSLKREIDTAMADKARNDAQMFVDELMNSDLTNICAQTVAALLTGKKK